MRALWRAGVLRWLVVIAVAAVAALAGCGGKAPSAAQFVGKWQSSRMNTAPLYLRPNGEWEIKTDDGQVMQFGVWEIKGRNLVWYIKMNGQLLRDSNAIVSMAVNRFELLEQDGSVSRFQRLD